MNTESPSSCPNCGEPIPTAAPGGLCPKCLLAGVVEQPTVPPPEAGSIETVRENFPDYEILELIGVGGIGRVYRARDPRVDRVVALKILSPERVADPEWIERFTREAKALARLNHPHIVQVHAFGTEPQPHLVMEYIEGVNLRQAMETGGLSAREALTIVPKLCDALHYAHENGVLHRDIKPENILVDTEGRVKLVDFGLAKLHDEGSLPFTLTQSGAKLGTLAYMAPEQVEKPSDVDHRADIYSLGVVFYEMLTGELPLGRFPSPSEANGTDPRLDSVVLRTLEKKKEKRFPDAGALATEIENASRGEPSAPNPPATSRPLPWVKILVVLLVLALATPVVVVVGYLNLQRRAAVEMAAEAEAQARMAQRLAQQKAEELEHKREAVAMSQKSHELARVWMDEAARTDDARAKAAAIQEILQAIRSDEDLRVLAGLRALPFLTEVEFDRSPFLEPVRRHLSHENWTIRGAAVTSLFSTDYDPSDVETVIGMIDAVPEKQFGDIAGALGRDCDQDFTSKHGGPMLRLLGRGFEAAKRGSYSETGFDSRGVLGVLWGAKVTPEIEALVIEWSKLDANDLGQINTASRGYNAFYFALSVIANKSTVSVDRLLLLARNQDTTNIGGRCLWGMKGTVPDPEDQKRVAGSVIELLGQRNGDYQWRRGLELLRLYASAEHVEALTDLAAREDLPDARKKALQEIIDSLSP